MHEFTYHDASTPDQITMGSPVIERAASEQAWGIDPTVVITILPLQRCRFLFWARSDGRQDVLTYCQRDKGYHVVGQVTERTPLAVLTALRDGAFYMANLECWK